MTIQVRTTAALYAIAAAFVSLAAGLAPLSGLATIA